MFLEYVSPNQKSTDLGRGTHGNQNRASNKIEERNPVQDISKGQF